MTNYRQKYGEEIQKSGKNNLSMSRAAHLGRFFMWGNTPFGHKGRKHLPKFPSFLKVAKSSTNLQILTFWQILAVLEILAFTTNTTTTTGWY